MTLRRFWHHRLSAERYRGKGYRGRFHFHPRHHLSKQFGSGTLGIGLARKWPLCAAMITRRFQNYFFEPFLMVSFASLMTSFASPSFFSAFPDICLLRPLTCCSLLPTSFPAFSCTLPAMSFKAPLT